LMLVALSLLTLVASGSTLQLDANEVVLGLSANGGLDDGYNTRVQLPANYASMSSGDMKIYLSKVSPEHFDEDGLLADHRLYSKQGVELESLVGLNNADDVYVTQPGQHFMWPHFWTGHTTAVSGLDRQGVHIESVAKRPGVFYLHSFLSAGEANELTRMAGGGNTDEVYVRDFDVYSEPARRLVNRAFNTLRVHPADDMAELRVEKYSTNQSGHIHYDWIAPFKGGGNLNPNTGGNNRFATVMVFLGEPSSGGQVVFPAINPLDDEELHLLSPNLTLQMLNHKAFQNEVEDVASLAEALAADEKQQKLVSTCFEQMSIQPRKGDAVLLYNVDTHFALDQAAEYGDCTVLAGSKLVAKVHVWARARGGGSVHITFRNKGPSGSLYWIDSSHEDAEVFQAGMGADSSLTVYVPEGHEFVFKVDGQEDFRTTTSKEVPVVDIVPSTSPNTGAETHQEL